MKKVINFEQDISNIDNITNGAATANYWRTNRVMLIPMKDGTYALGIDVRYQNEQGSYCDETCRIMLDENNVPYVEVGGEHSFTADNCELKIDAFQYIGSNGHHYIVEGYPLMTLDDGVNVPEKSVFRFVGQSREEPTIREYFAGYYRTAGFSQKGLAVVLKYIEDTKNKALLDERIRKPSKTEVDGMQTEIKTAVDGFFNGEVHEYEIERMLSAYNLITKRNGMNPSSLIDCDLAEYDYLLTKPQGQPQ